MSGTSLDGLDLVCVEFTFTNRINYRLIASQTLSYTLEWKTKLSNAYHLNESKLAELDLEYGLWLGNQVNDFITKNKLSIDLIASHGHTVFHQPKNKISLQIGNGKKIFEQTNIAVVNNFRQQDVLLGGQGAPLVPMGDELLFSEYNYCLNLGGFSNISWNQFKQRKACDLSPCNILMNAICQRIPLDYDSNGALASKGKIVYELLAKWNSIPFYLQAPPKSLGREWFEQNFLSDTQNKNYKVEDLLATSVHHIAFQINQFIYHIQQDISSSNTESKQISCLLTGGGAYNHFLVQQLQENSLNEFNYVLPNNELIDFKEAILFALLGYLRWNEKINVLASVTGAVKDHSSGDVYTN